VGSHKIYRVIDFAIVGKYTLRIRFDDDTEQIIDFEPVLHGPVFGPLRDPAIFSQVRLIEYAGCLEWPTGADFDPETLHDWAQVKNEIIQRRKAWSFVDA
jgi:hypothetical protein